jgi:hypothetical protein
MFAEAVGAAVGLPVLMVTVDTGAVVTLALKPVGADILECESYLLSSAVTNAVALAIEALMLCDTVVAAVLDSPCTLKETSNASATFDSRRSAPPSAPSSSVDNAVDGTGGIALDINLLAADPTSIDVMRIMLGSTPRNEASAALKSSL